MEVDKDNRELFERYLALDPELRREIFAHVFGRMRFYAVSGTTEQQAAAAVFFQAVERVIDISE